MKNPINKTRYSDLELNEFKKLIEAKLVEAKKQLNFYLNHLTEVANNSDSKNKGLADAISTAENERIATLAGRQKRHIQHLENALIRIETKVFGVCRESGKLISKARLRAVPHATLSIAAKQKKVV
ncbi:MAG TPA: TraR/DksA family transcriptional regulator [Saprospiraceae bacterium]|nr:TraR/DksA family transcriptional regulator [Saprospiraceae bacterium]